MPPFKHVLARHVCAQCMTAGCAVHKTLSVLYVGLWNVVCAVLYRGGEHFVLCYRKDMGWGCLRAGCSGRYLGLRRGEKQETGGNYLIRSFVVCTPEQTLLGRKSPWAGHVAWKEDLVNVYRVLTLKYFGKRKHGRPSGRWETILKFILNKIISGYEVWIHVAQVRGKWGAVVNTVMNFSFP